MQCKVVLSSPQCPFRRKGEKISREEVERRVREDQPIFVDKFSEDARLFCLQVSTTTVGWGALIRVVSSVHLFETFDVHLLGVVWCALIRIIGCALIRVLWCAQIRIVGVH